jgi:two-component system nitrogen regulation sensor histidine kinase NtrY
MGFRTLLPLFGRLALLVAAGAGAGAAWRSGYVASLALCLGLGGWALGRIIGVALARRELTGRAEGDAWSAVLEREREARRLTAFLDHAPVPLLAMRSRGALSALNLSARRFFSTDDVVVDAPAALVAAVLGAVPGVRQTLVLDMEGAARAYALTIAEVVSDGDFVRIAALVDIQAEVQAAEAAALRELMQVLSHEIMNSLTPVTSLALSTAALLQGPDEGHPRHQEAREAAESMARRAEGLLRFVEAYRELARLPPPRIADVDVGSLIEDVALLFRSRWGPLGVTLNVAVEAMSAAALDRDLVSQALLNVLTNAAEAALDGEGPPTVAMEAGRTAGGRLSITIRDNGPGVDLPDPSIILRPFFTTKTLGTGIGLSLARQVMLAHGGDIAVRPAAPAGLAVNLTF